jgi:hypothetical protein
MEQGVAIACQSIFPQHQEMEGMKILDFALDHVTTSCQEKLLLQKISLLMIQVFTS